METKINLVDPSGIKSVPNLRYTFLERFGLLIVLLAMVAGLSLLLGYLILIGLLK